jgi:hypothetical protein
MPSAADNQSTQKAGRKCLFRLNGGPLKLASEQTTAVACHVQRHQAQAHNPGAIMAIEAAALISTLASQASSSTNRQPIAAPAAAQRPSLADTATISPAAQSALVAATGGTSATQPDGTASGLGSVTGTSGTTYDFSSMTNSQAMTAAETLFSEGKISGQAENKLCMVASGANLIAINPTTGAYDPVAQASMEAARMSSTTPSNYEDTFKGFIADDNYFHETKAAAIDTEVLQDMEKYSSNAGSASVTPAANGAIISTAA